MQLLRMLILPVAVVAATESDDPLIAKFPDLVSWFTSNGGIIDPRIKIGYDENGIRGLIATDTILKGTVIINCPGNLVVKPEISESTDGCASIEHIIKHLNAGEKSKWHAYFDFDDSLGSRIPGEWKESSRAIAELQGLPPMGETHKHVDWYISTCTNGRDPSDIELRAFKIFLTRAADIGLIPMYDLMNHHNGLINTHLKRTDDGLGLTVFALTDIAPNEQIYNTYGRSGWETSTDLFLTYGFVEDYPQLWQWTDNGLESNSQDNEYHHFSRYIGNEEHGYEPNSDDYEVLVLSPDTAALYPTKQMVSILGNGHRTLDEWKQMIEEHHRVLRASHARHMQLSSEAYLERSPTTIEEDEKILSNGKYLIEQITKEGRVDVEKADIIQAIQYRLALKRAMKLAGDVARIGFFFNDSDEL